MSGTRCEPTETSSEHEDEELEPSVARASGQQDDAGDKPGYAPQATLDQFEMIRVDTMAKKELQKECEARDPFMDGTHIVTGNVDDSPRYETPRWSFDPEKKMHKKHR